MYSFSITSTQVICIFYLREVMNAGSDSDAQKFNNLVMRSLFKDLLFQNWTVHSLTHSAMTRTIDQSISMAQSMSVT